MRGVRLALAAIILVAAGTLATTQCQKPDPVGASGSYTVITKLCASFGAPDQARWGETLLPVHPKLL